MYQAIPINVAIIRGTTADSMGNITMERESLYVDNLIQAMAARASGGIVLAQVHCLVISRLSFGFIKEFRKERQISLIMNVWPLADEAQSSC